MGEQDMKKPELVGLAVVVLTLGMAAGIARALGPARFVVPFSFMAKDKELPAGTYDFTAQGEGLSQLMIRSSGGGGTTLVPVVTRLADIGAKQPVVVFDVAEGKHYLSEVHMPGADGFALAGAPGKHTHAKVEGNE
jgi:hypothetical protein